MPAGRAARSAPVGAGALASEPPPSTLASASLSRKLASEPQTTVASDRRALAHPPPAAANLRGVSAEAGADVESAALPATHTLDADAEATRLEERLPSSAPTSPRTRRLALALAALDLSFIALPGRDERIAPAFGALACALLVLPDGSSKSGSSLERLARGLAPLLAVLACLVAIVVQPAASRGAALAAAVIALAAALAGELVERRRLPLEQRAAALDPALGSAARRVHDGAVLTVPLRELRPGEDIVLEAGERVPADVTIVAGEALVEPWLGDTRRVTRGEGEALWAGARVVEGTLRAIVRWSGNDRAWTRLTLDPRRRADFHASASRFTERATRRAALALGALTGLAAIAAERPLATVLASAAVACAALTNTGLLEVVRAAVQRRVLELLERGVAFQSPEALDRVGQSTTVAFCARGTLLAHDTTLCSVEPTADLGERELLALAAGAARAFASPEGAAVLRAAEALGVQPARVRTPVHHEGRGVTAVASSGQPLMLGTRALTLEQHVSIATREARVNELEALGQTVLLCALEGRLVGLLALEDTLTSSARYAVQELLDHDVEPVLLSTSAQATSVAVARSLGIHHVRSELLPTERAREVERLAASGARVAVVGRGPADENALTAGAASLVVGSEPGSAERWDVEVISGAVSDAAHAVCVARELRLVAQRCLALGGAPIALCWLAALLGAPVWLLPLAALGGSIAALALDARS